MRLFDSSFYHGEVLFRLRPGIPTSEDIPDLYKIGMIGIFLFCHLYRILRCVDRIKRSIRVGDDVKWFWVINGGDQRSGHQDPGSIVLPGKAIPLFEEAQGGAVVDDRGDTTGEISSQLFVHMLFVPFHLFFIWVLLAEIDGIGAGIKTTRLKKMNMGVHHAGHHPFTRDVDDHSSFRDLYTGGGTHLQDTVSGVDDGLIGEGFLCDRIQETGMNEIGLCVGAVEGKDQDKEGDGGFFHGDENKIFD